MEEYGIVELLELAVSRCGQWMKIYLEWPYQSKQTYNTEACT